MIPAAQLHNDIILRHTILKRRLLVGGVYRTNRRDENMIRERRIDRDMNKFD